MIKDILGKAVNVGDIICYSRRGSGKTYLNIGIVQEFVVRTDCCGDKTHYIVMGNVWKDGKLRINRQQIAGKGKGVIDKFIILPDNLFDDNDEILLKAKELRNG